MRSVMLPNLSPLVVVAPGNTIVRCPVCASLYQKTSPTGCKECGKRKREGEKEKYTMPTEEERRAMLRGHTLGHPRKEWAFMEPDEGDCGCKDEKGKREAERRAGCGCEDEDDTVLQAFHGGSDEDKDEEDEGGNNP